MPGYCTKGGDSSNGSRSAGDAVQAVWDFSRHATGSAPEDRVHRSGQRPTFMQVGRPPQKADIK